MCSTDIAVGAFSERRSVVVVVSGLRWGRARCRRSRGLENETFTSLVAAVIDLTPLLGLSAIYRALLQVFPGVAEACVFGPVRAHLKVSSQTTQSSTEREHPPCHFRPIGDSVARRAYPNLPNCGG